jgi:hypothetical protein
MDDGADLSTDVLVVLIMQRPPPNACRQFRLVCLTALAAAHRHATSTILHSHAVIHLNYGPNHLFLLHMK